MTIDEFLDQENQPAYRIGQFHKEYYQNLIEGFDQVTSWPKLLRDNAEARVAINPLTPLNTQTSLKKDTVKTLFARKSRPDHLVETVLMRHRDNRNTVCVSCMVGCPMGCAFCATGSMGFVDNLTADEIVFQVLYSARLLKKEGQAVTNVVFMGMGEPMINLVNTQKAIAILTDRHKTGMSPGRITVSTCGVTAALKKFVRDGYKGRLAVSLHAPTQELREKVMPVAKTNPLTELFQVIDEYVKATNKRVSYEYILIKDLNDSPSRARELISLLKGRLAHVNLIPYNPVAGKPFRTPDKKRVWAFAALLEKARLPYTVRVTMGEDIQAACGQLATKKSQSSSREDQSTRQA